MDRRKVLKGLLAGAGTLLLPPYVSSATGGSDYRALVGVMLLGGNDAFNTLVPATGKTYADYQTIRSDMALAQNTLLTPGVMDSQGIALGVHPQMPEIAELFAQGDAVAVLNSGALMQPTTKAQILNRSAALPEFLFSHNSQINLMEAGTALPKAGNGWAGRMMDAFLIGSPDIPPQFSFGGNRKWLRADVGFNRLSTGAIPQLSALHHPDRSATYQRLQQLYDASPFAAELRKVMTRATYTSSTLANVFSRYPAQGIYPVGNPLANQLKSVETLIQAAADLGQSRQVFLVTLGGFDTHADMFNSHPRLLGMLSQAIGAFYQSLKAQGLASQVTTFTMSDFGRRLTSNGSGTDHGWGGHQLVFGGAVKGGAYGIWPSLAPDSDDHYSLGRVIPTTATDQVSATLCQWMGLETNALYELFPNLEAFDQPTLDFMA